MLGTIWLITLILLSTLDVVLFLFKELADDLGKQVWVVRLKMWITKISYSICIGLVLFVGCGFAYVILVTTQMD